MTHNDALFKQVRLHPHGLVVLVQLRKDRTNIQMRTGNCDIIRLQRHLDHPKESYSNWSLAKLELAVTFKNSLKCRWTTKKTQGNEKRMEMHTFMAWEFAWFKSKRNESSEDYISPTIKTSQPRSPWGTFGKTSKISPWTIRKHIEQVKPQYQHKRFIPPQHFQHFQMEPSQTKKTWWHSIEPWLVNDGTLIIVYYNPSINWVRFHPRHIPNKQPEARCFMAQNWYFSRFPTERRGCWFLVGLGLGDDISY